MCACMIYAGRFTAERQGNKPERIFSVWLGLCPGTGWLLSTCLTNPVPLQQISLLPVLAKIMRADLRASKGVCQHLGVCAGLDGGMREERMLWRLEIYWLPSAASLSASFLSPPQVSYSLAAYLWGWRPLSCSLLQWPAVSTDILAEGYQVYQQHYDDKRAWRQLNAAPGGAPASPLFHSVFSHPCGPSSFYRHDKNRISRADATALCWLHNDALWIWMNAGARDGGVKHYNLAEASGF